MAASDASKEMQQDLAMKMADSMPKLTAKLTESYLPAVMQALAYYIELIQYEPLHTTTIEPPFTVSTTPLTLQDTESTSTATKAPVPHIPVTLANPPTTVTQKPSTTTTVTQKPSTTTTESTTMSTTTTVEKPVTQSTTTTVQSSIWFELNFRLFFFL